MAETKWQIWFASPDMQARDHVQAGRVFKYRERAELEAAKVRAYDGGTWTAEVRAK
jgi:hypothetical protein